MTTRPSILLVGAAFVGLATPVMAQDGRYDDLPPVEYDVDVEQHEHDGAYDGGWQGEWIDDQHYQGEWDGTYHRDADYRDYHAEDYYAPGLAYTAAEREAWLSDCRVLMAHGGGYGDYDGYYYDRPRRDRNGALIGGVVGAVAGGIAGNRIADGNRTAGTLVGAGLGGLAGAAIGSVVDGDGRDDRYYENGYYRDDLSADELWAARYCEAYLRRYELGGGADYGYDRQVRVAQAPHGHHGHRHTTECTTVVTEEWVEVEHAAPPPRRPARRVVRRPAPAPEPGKRQRID